MFIENPILVRCHDIELVISFIGPLFAFSKRGNPVIKLDGFTFHKQRTQGDKVRWWCQYVQKGCKAAIYTLENEIIKIVGGHDPMIHGNGSAELEATALQPKIASFCVGNAKLPEWIPIYFVKVNDKEYRCNICEDIVMTDEKCAELLLHIQDGHKEVYDLHKDNLESTVGFQIEFLQFSSNVKSDEERKPVILEEICEVTGEVLKTEQKQEKDGVHFVLMPSKKKSKMSSEFSRKRSWVWKYFDKLTSIIYRCNLCRVVLSIKGCNTNNMNRHVRTRHPSIYKSETETKNEDTKSDLDYIDPLDLGWKKDDDSVKNKETINMMKQRRSWIWSYFNRISGTLAQCKLCNRNICHGGNATGNMNRHLKMVHNKTGDDQNWIWKVFEYDGDDFSCKICQFKCVKFDDVDSSVKIIIDHLKTAHGVVSSDQIITETEYELEQNAE